ncbi:MAG: helix-turn-helix transcriptional regulator [Rhodobacteraceae bacterium]|nr:helix-turn-helix transcriptional regulator [Paracoccaceae bacterium]
MDNSFSANLAFLCSYLPSVSEVCRRTAINRSQFNKYLTGAAHPNRHNKQKICDFFGVEEYELHLPEDQLRRLIQLRPNPIPNLSDLAGEPMRTIAELENLSSSHNLEKYVGFYYEYYESMAYPGKILKSLVHLELHDGKAFYSRTEKLQPVGSSNRGPRIIMLGQMLFLGQKLFLIDYESFSKAEICLTVMHPETKTVVENIHGLRVGSPAGEVNSPRARDVIWSYLGPKKQTHKFLKSIGLLDPSDQSLGPNLNTLLRV